MTRSERTEVLVVGAGPVGLLAALQLARRGVDARIVDTARFTKGFSYCLALHPSTLELLDDAGLAQDVIARGSIVNRVIFFEGSARLGEIRFGDLPGRFPHVVTFAISDDYDPRLWKKFSDLFYCREPIGFFHPNVHQNPIGKVNGVFEYSFGAIAAFVELSSQALQDELDRPAHSRIVIHYQDLRHFTHRGSMRYELRE